MREFINQLSDYQLLKKDSDVWRWVVTVIVTVSVNVTEWYRTKRSMHCNHFEVG
jgi:hypothetical protein